MDQIRDYDQFKRLVMRLATSFDKFANDDLIEAWWKALRTERYAELERRVEAFIANAGETTKFPRPGQFRTAAAPSFDPKQEASERRATEENHRNWQAFLRDHPKTGPIRIAMAQAARVIASDHESTATHAEAQREYAALERQLGPLGRFARDL